MPIAPEYLHMVFPNETFHALLYGRNSVDPKKKGRSVEDQLTDGRALCDRFGWPIVEEFKDTGISASRHGRKARDDFEELLSAIEAGAGRIVVAYEASRYYRDLEAYVRLRNACFAAGVLLCYNAQVYDLSKREDRKATAMDAIAAEDEAEGIRNRNVRTAQQTADKGGVWGKLPYGYLRKYDPDTGDLVGQYEHPAQGPYVLKAFQHVDSGGSLNSLIKWLNQAPDAVRTNAAPWSEYTVRYMLRNRVYLGERQHHDTLVKAIWEPIQGLHDADGRALFRRVNKILNDRATGDLRDSRAQHLLSHLALCGECGDHAVLKADKRARDKKRIYRCGARRDLIVLEEQLDAYVEQALLDWLRRKDTARAALIPDQTHVADEARKAQALLDVYTEELEEARRLARTRNEQGRPLLSLAALSAAELDLMPKIEELEQRLQSVTGVPLLVQKLLNAVDPLTEWNDMLLEQRREAIRRIVTVRLQRSRRGARRIEPGRVSLSFVGTDGFRDRPLRAPASVPGLPGAAAGGPEAV